MYIRGSTGRQAGRRRACERQREIFLSALDVQGDQERCAFISSSCGRDQNLRRRIEELLTAHEKAGAFLDKPAFDPTSPQQCAWKKQSCNQSIPDDRREGAGDRIGNYTLLEQIGEGGCGIVYAATQEYPVRRKVALKIVKPGLFSKADVVHLETERRILALMDHPNIVRGFEEGITESGRSYIILEFVPGMRVTDYCDQHRLCTRDRLALFVEICRTVQHVHDKGIIHRDIKPSNILVTQRDDIPVPKLIDFGIAQNVGQPSFNGSDLVSIRQLAGTPAYMSPEQAGMRRRNVDMRTDIYGLGILLYQMLTGRTPFDPKELIESGFDGMRRMIREREPLPPSLCLRGRYQEERATKNRRNGVESSILWNALEGELDRIVMKAIAKDRCRRYETATCFADAVQRYLDRKPCARASIPNEAKRARGPASHASDMGGSKI